MKTNDRDSQINYYRIYVVNEGQTRRNFWCFLQGATEWTVSDTLGRSDSMLPVPPNYQGLMYFTVPNLYVLGAGVANQEVMPGVRIDSTTQVDVQLQEMRKVDYNNAPPCIPPIINPDSVGTSPPGTIAVETNGFNMEQNNYHHCFGNASFGIDTGTGFMGITWSPYPSMNYTLTPRFAFYIATGNYEMSCLVDLNNVAHYSANVKESDFDNYEVTVTLAIDGTWIVTPGRPPESDMYEDSTEE